MPRPDKEFKPGLQGGRLDGPISPPVHSWTKYGGPETAETHRGSPSTIEVTVDDITVVERAEDAESKYTTRGTSAHDMVIPGVDHRSRSVSFVKEWTVSRSVEGRTYRRSDELLIVKIED
jgi:hypothetical protein